MAEITQDSVTRLGYLARISIDDELSQRIASQLQAILEYDAQLQQIDTTNETPTGQVTGLQDVWREDVVRPPACSQEQLLKNTPRTEDGYIKVPRVL